MDLNVAEIGLIGYLLTLIDVCFACSTCWTRQADYHLPRF